ncbi:uncharacterized protein [Aristolochia californica]|uniref:uncharacterized protein n=1 Tax=Aristolochia californica TaxID=171875 RepID=UPI0035DBF0B8
MVKQTSENSSLNAPADEQWRSASFSLHSLQKPLPPMVRYRNNKVPPKVYTVHPREFRPLVHRLTGAPSPRRQQLRRMAPPALPVDRRQYPPPTEPLQKGLQEKSSSWLNFLPALPKQKLSENPLESTFSRFLSPSSHAPWLLLSPGTMASLKYDASL